MSPLRLLTDLELQNLIVRDSPLVENLTGADTPFSASSPVQPCSVDLNVGNIFVPGTKLGDPGSVSRPLAEYTLGPGETAFITTAETLHLPVSIAAISFPPSRVSAGGILMTNPGHIDPGYHGPMHLTVINMSRQDFHVRRGSIIVTALFFDLGKSVEADWTARTGKSRCTPVEQSAINVLSKDFLDVSERATRLAEQSVEKSGLRLKALEAREKIVLAFLSIAIIAVPFVINNLTGVHELKAKVERLEDSQSVQKLTDRMKILEDQLSKTPRSGETNPNTGVAQ